VLALMLPLVEAEAGGLTRLWWLFPLGAALLAGFVAWERRVVARHREPLLDLRLLNDTAGYATGARWARCTSSGSPGSGWSSRCSSRAGWATRPCSPGSR
jgi:hypothetical protein